MGGEAAAAYIASFACGLSPSAQLVDFIPLHLARDHLSAPQGAGCQEPLFSPGSLL